MLPGRIGQTRARRLLLTAEAWTAHQALTNGVISEVVSDELLDRTAQDLAESVAALDPAAVRRMLGLVRDPGTESAWTREWDTLAAHMATQGPGSAEDTLQRLRHDDLH